MGKKIDKMSDQIVNSHIQMPRCVLKRFEDAKNKFYYYDIKKRIIGSNGHAKSINTELGYFSPAVEEFLNNYVEKPFSDLLKKIDKIDFDSASFFVPSETNETVKRFMYSLMARSQQMLTETKNNSVFFQFMSSKNQHDYAVGEGIRLAVESNILRDYFITFAVNKSPISFVLPMMGLYSIRINNIGTSFLPISPQLSIVLVNREGKDALTKNGLISMFLITESDKTIWLNKQAFATQMITGSGYVVSVDKPSLEGCITQ